MSDRVLFKSKIGVIQTENGVKKSGTGFLETKILTFSKKYVIILIQFKKGANQMKKLFFLLIGILGVSAAIILILNTVQYLIVALIAKNFLSAFAYLLYFIAEMLILNYLINDYHGEEI